MDDLFLFGEDFDAIFDILEEEDSVEKGFADAVANVSMINSQFGIYCAVFSIQKSQMLLVNKLILYTYTYRKHLTTI